MKQVSLSWKGYVLLANQGAKEVGSSAVSVEDIIAVREINVQHHLEEGPQLDIPYAELVSEIATIHPKKEVYLLSGEVHHTICQTSRYNIPALEILPRQIWNRRKEALPYIENREQESTDNNHDNDMGGAPGVSSTACH